MFDLFSYEWKNDFFNEKVQIWFFYAKKKKEKKKKNDAFDKKTQIWCLLWKIMDLYEKYSNPKFMTWKQWIFYDKMQIWVLLCKTMNF